MKTNNIVVGILAHTDSGKTTLSESLLYLSGSIRKYGRVDHGDTFLDTNRLEKSRGITIFSKQAQFKLPDRNITLLDTPGHVDFSAEMERVLQVLDYAILVISGADGIQGHTQTLWKLLKVYQIPTFIFINKMDQNGTEKLTILSEVQRKLSECCIDFGQDKETEGFYEQVAMCDEKLMETYLENGFLDMEMIREAIYERKVYPCYFGSALKLDGVEELLKAMNEDMLYKDYPEEFGARVFKIVRDEQDNRLSYMKVTGGKMKVKDLLTNKKEGQKANEKDWSEKVDQIRIYSGSQYELAEEVRAGMVCAVTGLSNTFCGEGLGIEKEPEVPVLESVLTYKVNVPEETNVHTLYLQLCQLEEEEPELHIVWDENSKEIHVQVMGEVQIEVLKSMIQERFHVDVEFDSGSIVYKETIEEPMIGIGHFEPLRHYAEVHLMLEPLERGSGLEFATNCSEDILDRNWQRLVMTHLEEKKHKGVLTGSEITDMRITLIAGKAHLKHTEGGDFRQATYRAVRQGLKRAKSKLLEPVYEYRLEIPQEMLGRAMTDIQRMYGNFDAPIIEDDIAVLIGTAPVLTMQNYQREVISYTRGHGKLFCTLKGYELCHNEDEVIAEKGYDSESDLDNPTGSVFCAHGAGFVVSWNDVPSHAHIEYGRDKEETLEEELIMPIKQRKAYLEGVIGQEEVEEIFARTFGNIKKERIGWKRTITASSKDVYSGRSEYTVDKKLQEYLLVDGYNIIFAWEELNELSKVNIDSARDKLMDIMCNYQGYKKCELILVFDAYKVAGGKGEIFDYHNIHVVYTREAETADHYIEKFTHENGKKYDITVATSDRLEQMIIWGAGAKRMSASGLLEEVQGINQEISEQLEQKSLSEKNYLFDQLKDKKKDLINELYREE